MTDAASPAPAAPACEVCGKPLPAEVVVRGEGEGARYFCGLACYQIRRVPDAPPIPESTA